MPVTLYRRHLKACAVHKSKLTARAKRAFMDCDCPIWVYGRTDKILVPRQSMRTSHIKVAELERAALIADSKDQTVHGPKLKDCIQKYLSSRKHELSDKTQGHHRLLLSRLEAYCVQRGVYFARELGVDLLETFIVDGLPNLADTSKGTMVSKLRCFLRDAFRRGWIEEALAEKIRAYKAVYEQKEPFIEEEVEKILAEAWRLNGGTHGYSKHPKTFRLLLELMLETGMRVGDAVRFDPSVPIRGDKLWIYSYVPQKQRKAERRYVLEAYLTDRLKTAIDEAEWLSTKLPFHYGNSRNPAYLANEVYARMQTIGDRCGVVDCRPHRLRDTFAVRKLLRGVGIEDVSKLLGHSSVKVTEMYYAKWIPARKRRLEGIVAESLLNP